MNVPQKVIHQTNMWLKLVDRDKCTVLIRRLSTLLRPVPNEDGGKPQPVSMPDATAAVATVLCEMIMQCPDAKQRMLILNVTGAMLANNLNVAITNEAIDKAAAEAVAAERGTANGRPI